MSLSNLLSNRNSNQQEPQQHQQLFAQNFLANRRASGKMGGMGRVNSESDMLPLKREKAYDLPKVSSNKQLAGPPQNFQASYQLDNLQRLKQSINENIESFAHQKTVKMQEKVSKLSLFDRNTHLKADQGPPTFLLDNAPNTTKNQNLKLFSFQGQNQENSSRGMNGNMQNGTNKPQRKVISKLEKQVQNKYKSLDPPPVKDRYYSKLDQKFQREQELESRQVESRHLLAQVVSQFKSQAVAPDEEEVQAHTDADQLVRKPLPLAQRAQLAKMRQFSSQSNFVKIDKIEKMNEFANFKQNFKEYASQKPGLLKPYHPPEIQKVVKEPSQFASQSQKSIFKENLSALAVPSSFEYQRANPKLPLPPDTPNNVIQGNLFAVINHYVKPAASVVPPANLPNGPQNYGAPQKTHKDKNTEQRNIELKIKRMAETEEDTTYDQRVKIYPLLNKLNESHRVKQVIRNKEKGIDPESNIKVVRFAKDRVPHNQNNIHGYMEKMRADRVKAEVKIDDSKEKSGGVMEAVKAARKKRDVKKVQGFKTVIRCFLFASLKAYRRYGVRKKVYGGIASYCANIYFKMKKQQRQEAINNSRKDQVTLQKRFEEIDRKKNFKRNYKQGLMKARLNGGQQEKNTLSPRENENEKSDPSLLPVESPGYDARQPILRDQLALQRNEKEYKQKLQSIKNYSFQKRKQNNSDLQQYSKKEQPHNDPQFELMKILHSNLGPQKPISQKRAQMTFDKQNHMNSEKSYPDQYSPDKDQCGGSGESSFDAYDPIDQEQESNITNQQSKLLKQESNVAKEQLPPPTEFKSVKKSVRFEDIN